MSSAHEFEEFDLDRNLKEMRETREFLRALVLSPAWSVYVRLLLDAASQAQQKALAPLANILELGQNEYNKGFAAGLKRAGETPELIIATFDEQIKKLEELRKPQEDSDERRNTSGGNGHGHPEQLAGDPDLDASSPRFAP